MSRFQDEDDPDNRHVHDDPLIQPPSIASIDLERSGEIITTAALSDILSTATPFAGPTSVGTTSYAETTARPTDSNTSRAGATPTASVLSEPKATNPTTSEERAREEREWQANTKTWIASMVSVLAVIIIMILLRVYLRRKAQKSVEGPRELPAAGRRRTREGRRRTSDGSSRRSSGYYAELARYQSGMGGLPLDCLPTRTRMQADAAVAEYERDLELGRLRDDPAGDLSRIPPDAELPTYTEAAQAGERIMGGPNGLRPASALMEPDAIASQPPPNYNTVVRE